MMNLIICLKAMKFKNNKDKRLLKQMLLKILIKSREEFKHLEIKNNDKKKKKKHSFSSSSLTNF